MGANVAAGEDLFQMLEKRSVHGHHVFKVTVDRAVLHHQDLAVALDNLRLDLASLLVHQDFDRQLAVNDLLTNFRDALRAERIGGARPAQWRLRLLVRLQQGLVRPLRRKRRIGIDAVELVEYDPCALGGNGNRFLNVLNRFVHLRLSKKIVVAACSRGTSAKLHTLLQLQAKQGRRKRQSRWSKREDLAPKWGYVTSNGSCRRWPILLKNKDVRYLLLNESLRRGATIAPNASACRKWRDGKGSRR